MKCSYVGIGIIAGLILVAEAAAAPTLVKGAAAGGACFGRCVEPDGDASVEVARDMFIKQGQDEDGRYYSARRVSKLLRDELRAELKGVCAKPNRLKAVTCAIDSKSFGSVRKCNEKKEEVIVDKEVPAIAALAYRWIGLDPRYRTIRYGFGWRLRWTPPLRLERLVQEAVVIALRAGGFVNGFNLEGEELGANTALEGFVCEPRAVACKPGGGGIGAAAFGLADADQCGGAEPNPTPNPNPGPNPDPDPEPGPGPVPTPVTTVTVAPTVTTRPPTFPTPVRTPSSDATALSKANDAARQAW